MAMKHKGELEVEIGLGLPEKTTAEIDAYVPPREGYMVFDKDTKEVKTKTSTGGGGADWKKVSLGPDFDPAEYATAAQGTTADSAIQPGDNISTLVNDSFFISDLSTKSVGDLGDVDITTSAPTDGQTLVWASGEFVPVTPAAGVSAIDDLSDVTITTAADGHALVYLSGVLVNRVLTKADVSDFVETDYATGAEGDLATSAVQPTDSVGTLADVDLTVAATSGQTLTWDGISKFVPTTLDASSVDVSDKADKIVPAAVGNIATLDAAGNLTDSGSLTTAFATSAQGATADTALQDLTTSSVGSLSDVDITSVLDGQILVWATDKFVVQAPAAGVTTIDGLTDTTITAVADGDFLRHNGVAWVDGLIVAGDIPDLSSTYATFAQGATADTALQNITSESIGDLSDVDITTIAPTDGQVLTWNATNGEFVAQATAATNLSNYVTIDGAETITGTKTFKAPEFYVEDAFAQGNVKRIEVHSGGPVSATWIRSPVDGSSYQSELTVSPETTSIVQEAQGTAISTIEATVQSVKLQVEQLAVTDNINSINITNTDIVLSAKGDAEATIDAGTLSLTDTKLEYSKQTTAFTVDHASDAFNVTLTGQSLIDYTGTTLDLGVKGTSPFTVDGDGDGVLTTKAWVLGKITAGTGAVTLDALTDTTITAAATGDFLRHNGTAWVDHVLVSADLTDGATTFATFAQGATADTAVQPAALGNYVTLDGAETIIGIKTLTAQARFTGGGLAVDGIGNDGIDVFNAGHATFYSGNYGTVTGQTVEVRNNRISLTANDSSDTMVSFDKTVSGSATTPGLQWRDTGANIATVVYDVASSTVQLKHGTTNAFSVGAAETTSTDPIRYTALTIGNIDTAGNDKTLVTKEYVLSKVGGAAAATSVGDLSDVIITSEVIGHGLFWDGSDWINRFAVKNDISDFVETAYVHQTGDETIAGIKTFSDDVTIGGDLTVSGTTTYVNSTNTEITDSIIMLNSGESGAGVTSPTQSGLEIERGTEFNAYMIWSEANDKFGFGYADSLVTPTIQMATFEAFATETYVDARSYSADFLVGAWTVGTPNTLVITQATHGVPASNIYHVTVVESGEIVTVETSISAGGDVTLTTTGATFGGSIRISL